MKNGQQSAFPLVIKHDEHQPFDGLTKREYFAAMAMQGLCLNGAWDNYLQKKAESVGANSSVVIVAYAIDLADELLKQLES